MFVYEEFVEPIEDGLVVLVAFWCVGLWEVGWDGYEVSYMFGFKFGYCKVGLVLRGDPDGFDVSVGGGVDCEDCSSRCAFGGLVI